MHKYPALALGVLALAACAPQATTTSTPNPHLHPPRPLVIAHQGGEGLRPSNTMLAFQHAATLGADVLETDVHATRDGTLVLSHDATVDRLTNGQGTIRDLTLEQVRALDAGYAFTPDGGRTYPYRGAGARMATARELLTALPDRRFIMELKQETPSIAQPFCTLLRETNATDRVIVASFSDRALREFRAACPGVMTSMTESELRPLVLLSKVGLARLAPAPGQVVQVPVRSGNIEVVTPGFVAQMHARGIAVQVWTINDPTEMRRLLDMGVDGIITDRPDLLLGVLAER